MADIIPPELLKSLEAVTLLVKNVLDDIKDHSTSLAIVKTKLEDLANNVDKLAHVVVEGNGKGSMVTRMALLEQGAENLEEQINDLKEEVSKSLRDLKHQIELGPQNKTDEEEKRQKREATIAKFQFWGALLAAFVALGLQLFGMIHK